MSRNLKHFSLKFRRSISYLRHDQLIGRKLNDEGQLDTVQKHIDDFGTRLPMWKKSLMRKWSKSLVPVYSLKTFELLYDIGRGGFGRVVLAKHLDNRNSYAIKIVEKQHVVKAGHMEHFKSEMRVLNSVKFNSLIHMSFFFFDNVYIYIGMPYISGGIASFFCKKLEENQFFVGDLFSHIKMKGKFEEDLSKFYATQVILGLEYMHFAGIIYRDLKPENILLEENGYIKLTDYGFAKMLSGKNYRTYSFCGTLEYLAPEVILSKGYGLAADWWSLGVLIYEMNAGYSPFRKGSPIRLFEAITTGAYRFPDHFSEDLKSLISKLLVTNPMDRYGNLRNGVNDIKTHDWLKSYDWCAVYNRTMRAKYRPRAKISQTTLNITTKDITGFRSSPKPEYENEFKWLEGGLP